MNSSYLASRSLLRLIPALILSAGIMGSTVVRASSDSAEPEEPTSSWPWNKLESPRVPVVERKEWVKNPIDAFVFAKMEANELRPAPLVSNRVLLRRLYFDLIGLPPTPKEMARFLNDASADAYKNEIERLLADRRYGERWGRHWLDVVRYADSGGGGLDFPLPHMWRYRDYVIRAFNQDRPYDRFVREQIAGDAFPAYGSEGKIGVGFLRLGVFLEGTRQEMRRELLNDIVGTTGSVFLGITLGCARCHDHKFDPIPTHDYYRLEAFFAAVTIRPEAVPFTQYENGDEWTQKGKQWEEALAKRQETTDKIKEEFKARVVKALAFSLSAPQDLKDLAVPIGGNDLSAAMAREDLFTQKEKELYRRIRRMGAAAANQRNRYQPMAYSATELLGASNDPGPNYPIAPTTYVLEGGDPKLRGDAVEPGFLSEITGNSEPVNLDGVQHSRRKELAEWISSADNPLTARVMVNRIWQYHFDEGLVPTASDFGANGIGTNHPELIDWLAWQFIESGWSVKAMHRLILRSNVYRQSLHNPLAKEYGEIDPDGRFLWQRKPIRLEAETIRDSILAVSGALNPAMGGPGFFPEIDDQLLNRASTWWEPSPEKERNRRSIYMLQKRAIVYPLIRVFDGANVNESCATRGVTTVTPQVFALFNSKFVHDKSQVMAKRILREAGTNPERQIERAYWLSLQRPPSSTEHAKCRAFLRENDFSRLCLVLLNLNEFIYLE